MKNKKSKGVKKQNRKGKKKGAKKKKKGAKQSKEHHSRPRDYSTEVSRLRDDLLVRKSYASSDKRHRNNFFTDVLRIESKIDKLNGKVDLPEDIQVIKYSKNI